MLPKKTSFFIFLWGLVQVSIGGMPTLRAQLFSIPDAGVWPGSIYTYHFSMNPNTSLDFPEGVDYLEMLPYLSKEQAKSLGVKRLNYLLIHPDISAHDRRFVIDQAPDTVHVMDFDREGRMTHLRSLDLALWAVKTPDWQKMFDQVRTESLKYDSLGRLFKIKTARLNRKGKVWVEEEYNCRFLDSAVVWTLLPLNQTPSLEYDGVLSKGWMFRLNDSGQTIWMQRLIEVKKADGKIKYYHSPYPRVQYHYNAKGRISAWKDSQWLFTKCIYDKEEKLLSMWVRDWRDPNSSDKLWLKCQYDDRGYLTSLRWEEDVSSFKWTWDERGIPNSHSFPHPAYPQRQITYQIEVEFWE